MLQNPFRTALLATALIAAVLAIVLGLIGATLGSPYDDPAYVAAQRAPVWAIGGALGGLAISTILLWLHASAISWAAEHPSPPKPVES